MPPPTDPSPPPSTLSMARAFDVLISSTSFPLLLKYALMVVYVCNDAISVVIQLHQAENVEETVLALLAWTFLCFHPWLFWFTWVPFWFPLVHVSTTSRSSDDLTALLQGCKVLSTHCQQGWRKAKRYPASVYVMVVVVGVAGWLWVPQWMVWWIGVVVVCGGGGMVSLALAMVVPKSLQGYCGTVWKHWQQQRHLQRVLEKLKMVCEAGLLKLVHVKHTLVSLSQQPVVAKEEEAFYLSLLHLHFEDFTSTDVCLYSLKPEM